MLMAEDEKPSNPLLFCPENRSEAEAESSPPKVVEAAESPETAEEGALLSWEAE
jgi:hypothetical protein